MKRPRQSTPLGLDHETVHLFVQIAVSLFFLVSGVVLLLTQDAAVGKSGGVLVGYVAHHWLPINNLRGSGS